MHALEVTLKAAQVNYELFRYDAQHGFFNEQRPEVYNAEASTQAWERMLRFICSGQRQARRENACDSAYPLCVRMGVNFRVLTPRR